MGVNMHSPKNNHSPKKLNGVYDAAEEAFDLSNMNKAMFEEGDDAGGAIMKKLYRIHSRYVLEPNDSLKIDISGQMVEVNGNKRGARPLEETNVAKVVSKYYDPSHLNSLFMNKYNIADFEEI